MPIPRKGGCRYKERRDADAEGCNTERPGMPMPSESDADAEGYQVIIPITQQLSGLLASRCERQVWKLFQDKSAVWRTSNLLQSLLHSDNTDANETPPCMH
jgi:hypothetical protein